MNAAAEPGLESVERYLSDEDLRAIRHEYIEGHLYPVPEVSVDHNTIAGNIAITLRSHMHSKECRVFMSQLKVRLAIGGKDIFYYPDVMVACDARDTDPYFKRFPRVVIEVLSPGTERVDRVEKFWNYIQIETLQEYVLVAQDRMGVTIFRRRTGWKSEILCKPEEWLRLVSIDFSMTLPAIYEAVSL
jgi:Uma2 family endonuclease